jgi:hypothetical protein
MVTAVVVLAACSSGTARHARRSVSPPSSSTPISSPAPLGCPGGAAYCDAFNDPSSGWGDTNQADYYYGYNAFMGGTYRIGSRAASTIDSSAPKQLGDIAPQYGIRVDADVVINPSSPAGAAVGLTCWAHPSADGKAESAFVFFVYADHVKVVLWDAPHGTAVDVSDDDISVLKPSGTWNHLTATCTVAHDPSGAAIAQLDLRVNGTDAVSANYDSSTSGAQWSASSADGTSHVGVLASGAGADAFFDNVALTPQ